MLYTLSVFYNSCVTVLWIVNVSLSVRNFVISGHNKNSDATDIYELYIGIGRSSVLKMALIRLETTCGDKFPGQFGLWGAANDLDRLRCHQPILIWKKNDHCKRTDGTHNHKRCEKIFVISFLTSRGMFGSPIILWRSFLLMHSPVSQTR
jgi:hypothetical protein